jgi:hypothetical protein
VQLNKNYKLKKNFKNSNRPVPSWNGMENGMDPAAVNFFSSSQINPKH